MANKMGDLHVVPAIEAVSITAAKNGDVVGCHKAHEVEVDVLVGSLTPNLVITIQECSDTTPSASTAIVFNYQISSAVGTDTIGAVTAATTVGVTLAATTDNNKLVRCYIDPAALTAGYPYIRVVLTPAAATACLVAAMYIIRDRYPQEVPASAVA